MFFYPRWEVDPQALWQLAFPAALMLLAAVLWWQRRRIGRGPLAAVLIFVGVLTPALGFFDVYPFRYSFVADHFQYHASAALIAGAAALATVASRRLGRRASWAALLTAVRGLAALGTAARRQVRVYRDLPTLYESVIAANPASWAARNNLGRFLQNLSRYEEAIGHFEAALRLAPQHARIRNNLGSSLASLGRLDEAAAELERARLCEGEATDSADTSVYLAVVRIRQERFAEAAALLRTALQIRPRDPWALYNLGVALGGGGELEAGAAAVRASLAIDPASAIGHHELGALRRALGDWAGAVYAFSEAARLEPGAAAYRTDLALALLQSGDLARAERELRSALAADPGHADAANSLGIVLGTRGDFDGAEAAFEAALRTDPGHADAGENLRRLREATAPPPPESPGPR